MIRTRFTEMFGVDHPIALGGMGSVYSPPLVAAVSEAGGFGALGCHALDGADIKNAAAEIRSLTNKPFALNHLLFLVTEDSFAASLEAGAPAMAFAWPRADQELKPYFDRAHAAGALITFMAGNVADAVRGVEAGADLIIAQGTEGGGHVSWMATAVLLPLVLDAVPGVPVLAAGGMADGRGLAAALAFGADGILLGTRFLATEESPLHPNFKQAIVDSDGHDTVLTELPDLAAGTVWPGAMTRAHRNRFIARWAGREWMVRQNQAEIAAGVAAARAAGDADETPLSMGQDSGLIHDIPPAADIVTRIAAEAEEIVAKKLPGLVT